MFAEAVRAAAPWTRPIAATFTSDGDPSVLLTTSILLNTDGWILTAAHSMEMVEKLRATHDDFSLRLDGEIVETATDEEHDLYAGRIAPFEGVGRDLPTWRPTVPVGTSVAALGVRMFPVEDRMHWNWKPLENDLFPLDGIVAATESDPGRLLLSSPIVQSHSGGPVVDRKGAIVGMTTGAVYLQAPNDMAGGPPTYCGTLATDVPTILDFLDAHGIAH